MQASQDPFARVLELDSPYWRRGVTIGILIILWMSLSPTGAWPDSLSGLRSPLHSFMVTVVGTLTILLVGLTITWIRTAGETPAPRLALNRPIEEPAR